LVVANDYRIGTGFLTTPFILPVLTDYGFADTAYRVALNRKRPGWLYEVEKGATTIWENWNGLDEHNVPKDSFNHYSFGTIVGWLFSRVAGVTPLLPGFRKTRIRPVPGGGLTKVKCRYDSAAGMISTSWTVDRGEFRLTVDVPTETLVELPDGSSQTVPRGVHGFSCRAPG
jgi:alpha-L-rhamnosidase